MSQHSHPSSLGGQGVGARILRKEDARHLNGQGNFIGNMTMPGLQEVAFLRSPMAHARIRQINIEDSARAQVITRADMPDCLDIYAASTLPS